MIHDSPSYHGPRHDVLQFLNQPRRLLDVGCNRGVLARAARMRFPEVRVWGIDLNPEALAMASDVLVKGWCLDLDDTAALHAALGELWFDHIVAADVLEHTVNFARVTGILYAHLEPGGQMLLSVPNTGHWHLLWVFLSRRWPRNERGIFDRTHRSVFLWRNLPEFVAECPGAELVLLRRNLRFFETNRWPRLNRAVTCVLYPLWWVPYVNDLLTHQYIFAIRRPLTQAGANHGARQPSSG